MQIVASKSVSTTPASQQGGQRAPAAVPSTRRRALAALPAAALVWTASQQRALGSENAGGVDSATSPLVQELLRRTEEKKAERAKERLDDYYRRNFGDYLSFQAGSAPGSSSSENQERIRQWLQQNSEPALPAAAAAKRRQERGASE
ncbi:hypothetical protein ABPG77_007019 [Micractinium sp. CCAP 211/92]